MLRSAGMICTESVLSHPGAEDESDNIEVSRIGLDCNCCIVQTRIFCSASAPSAEASQ